MYKNELQIIDSKEKAYLLGLFYSDGSLGNNIKQSRITLKNVDRDIIIFLHNKFHFFNLYENPKKNQIELNSCKKEVYFDLLNNGCYPRKSFENKNLLRLPQINELIPHFIRGYFDGDGGCSLSISKKKIQKRVYIYSVSKLFLEETSNYLIQKGINNTITKTISNSSTIMVYKLSINTNSYERFYNFLYNDCGEFFIKRKQDLYLEILNTNFFIKKDNIPCVFCNSINTVCDGFSKYKIQKQRYLCKNCNRHFTAPLLSN
jgi:intein/homing endonuclease